MYFLVNFRIITIFLLFSITANTQTGSDVVVITDLTDECRRQQMILLSDSAFREKIPERLRPILNIPKTIHQIMNPLSLFSFAKGFESCSYQVPMNEWAVAPASEFEKMPFILTSGLSECVGVTIRLPGVKCGLIHAGFAAVDRGLLAKFINAFEPESRARCEVRLTSAVLSPLTGDVYEALIKAGFKICSADVHDVYLECEGRASSGNKYYPYSRSGLTKKDVYELKDRPRGEIIAELEKRYMFTPDIADAYRVMVLDMRTGKSYEFLETLSFPEANSKLVDLLAKIIPHVLRFPSDQHENALRMAVNKFLNVQISALREKAVDAMNCVGQPYGEL